MLTLENRRKMFDLINKYKEQSMKEDGNKENSTRMTRSKTDKQLDKPRFRLEIRKHSYKKRVVDHLNSLPLKIRTSNSIKYILKKKM